MTSGLHSGKRISHFKNLINKSSHTLTLLNNSDILNIIGIIIPLTTLLIIGYILYQTISSFISHLEILENTSALSPMLERMLLYLVDAETGQRGYLITGNANHLQPYSTSITKIDDQVQSLLNATSKNLTQQNIIKKDLLPLVDRQLGLLEQSITLNGNGLNVSSPFNNTTLISESKMNMDKIRTIVQSLENDQNNFLKNRSASLEHESNTLLTRLLILILIISLITTITIFSINYKIKNRNIKTKKKLEYEIAKNTKVIRESNVKLKDLNSKLVKHDKLQRDFINIAAHELRTPCQAIAGYSELALLDRNYKALDLKFGGFITSIDKNASRLQDLVEKILDVAKIESNSLVLNMENVDIVKEILDISKDFGDEIERNNGKIILNYKYKNQSVTNKKLVQINLIAPDYPIIVKIDKIRIYQVITNILNNAIKATLNNLGNKKDDALITISIKIRTIDNVKTENEEMSDSVPDKFVIVSVTDSGKGISREISPYLFSKFASYSEKGTGLGLFISKSIIEMHGGKIRIFNSHTQREGATVEFSIPYNPKKRYNE